MSIYDYRAKDKQGVVRKGTVEATTMIQASEVLHRSGFVVLELAPQKQNVSIDKYLPFFGRVSRKELVMFSRQLATLIKANMPIIQSLEILTDQVSSRKLKTIIGEMVSGIEGGSSLSESMAHNPEVFSNLYVNLIKAGELSGSMDKALMYVADQQEKEYDLTAKIRGAMIYPVFIISAIVIVGVLMFIFVLPQLIGMLQEAGAELPITTRILIFITNIFQRYWAILLVVVVGGAGGFRYYVRTPGGRLVWDTAKMKIPILGKLLQKIYVVRLARNLSTMIASRIPIVQALRTVAEIVGNSLYEQVIMDAAVEVENGKSIGTVFSGKTEFPDMVSQMMKIGEQTGSLDEILGKLADFYDKEVSNILGSLTTLLEPIIMLLLGVAMAVMVAGILLPIYNLASVQ